LSVPHEFAEPKAFQAASVVGCAVSELALTM
jgi:hypothetical protein